MPLHEHSLAIRLCSGVLAETQDAILHAIDDLRLPRHTRQRLLDVGCWDGSATVRYGAAANAELHGIEIFPAPAREAAARGLQVAGLDLEQAPFPDGDASFDVVVANQVFEHLKNIWLPLTEIHRVLRVGGHFFISVPNLASLHNRALLALGRQPTSIRTLGMHVRGYTLHELLGLVTLGGVFAVQRVIGVGFYPLPARLARPLARLWPGASHTVVVVLRKTADVAVSPWQAYREQEIEAGAQTFYG